MTWDIREGDCVEAMQALEPESVDAVVCDPPYGLEFMGKDWDRLSDDPVARSWDTKGRTMTNAPEKGKVSLHRKDNPRCDNCGRAINGRATAKGFKVCECEVPAPRLPSVSARKMQAWHEVWGREAFRVLKPGGHLLAFGGTRTYHRLACALEDAGFEIRDCLAWLFGSGFPKSLDVSKAIDKRRDDEALPEAHRWEGWGTALKPAHEPIVLARKPLVGTVAGNVLEHGTGGLNVDGCRIAGPKGDGVWGSSQAGSRGTFTPTGSDYRTEPNEAGRWPANVILDEPAAALLDEPAAALLDEQSGERPGAVSNGSKTGDGLAGTATFKIHARPQVPGRGDSGGASRFFYVAKASRAERNAGLEGFEERDQAQRYGNVQDGRPHTRDGYEYPRPAARNHHPTVKPVSLMRWLVRLVTPPGGLVLDPFVGSGTTGVAAVLEGFRFVGLEREPEYVELARARIRWWQEHGEDALRIVAERERAEAERLEAAAAGQLELLADGVGG